MTNEEKILRVVDLMAEICSDTGPFESADDVPQDLLGVLYMVENGVLALAKHFCVAPFVAICPPEDASTQPVVGDADEGTK
jgi:hypothetical protein